MADAGAIVVSLAFTTAVVAKAAVASAKAATRGFVRRIVTVACGRLMLVAVSSCLEVREILDSEGTELLLRSILTYLYILRYLDFGLVSNQPWEGSTVPLEPLHSMTSLYATELGD